MASNYRALRASERRIGETTEVDPRPSEHRLPDKFSGPIPAPNGACEHPVAQARKPAPHRISVVRESFRPRLPTSGYSRSGAQHSQGEPGTSAPRLSSTPVMSGCVIRNCLKWPSPGTGMRDQRHVSLGVDQRGDTLTKKIMIVPRENPDRVVIAGHKFIPADGI